MNRIKELRNNTNMKQSELAKLMKCTEMTISRYERSESEIDSVTICKLCEIFHCTADYLLCRSETKMPALTDRQAALLEAYDRASDRDKNLIKEILSAYEEKKESAVS